MIYLIIAILCSSMFSVMFKICHKLNIDSNQAILFNFITAFVFCLVPILINIAGGVEASSYLLSTKSFLFSILQGLLFMLGFIVMAWSTGISGVALTTAAARAALLIPVLLSWILLGQPAPSWLGVILILVAMCMIILPAGTANADSKVERAKKAGSIAAVALVVVFVSFGISDFVVKLGQKSVEDVHVASAEMMNRQLTMLTCSIFLMASIASLLTCVISGSFKKHPLKWRGVLGGVALGLFNCGCTWGMLHGLGVLPTGTFYPLYNIGIVIVATMIGVIAFKEKLRWLQIAGLAVAIGAIVLITG